MRFTALFFSSDWFMKLFVRVVIGSINYSGFGFTIFC